MILDDYDALLLDLDGTVYRGGAAVPGAVDAIAAAAEREVTVRFVTNNASRPPDVVAAALTDLGLTASADEVNTSAQAAAAMLAERWPAGATVLIVGSEALAAEVSRCGLSPVWDNDKPVDAVVQGLDKGVGWRHLAEATVAINAGAVWVACNVDPTLPTERGLMPGNGALVAALRTATGAEPEVAGKPAAPLLRQAIESAAAAAPLVVGDRLDTDIAGAHAVGVDSLFVLTGVSTAADLLDAPETHRPRYVAADLRGLFGDTEELAFADSPQWTIADRDGALAITGSGDELTLLRGLCRAVWALPRRPPFQAGDEHASRALRQLGLTER